jgi:predicted RNA-binding protein YlqC (UPF0109 family)
LKKEKMIEPKEYLEYIVKGLVENPDDVKVTRTVDEMGVLLTLEVNSADMGQVIGRQGATAKAMRTLIRVCGMKNQERVNVKISEPDKDEVDAAEASGEPESE